MEEKIRAAKKNGNALKNLVGKLGLAQTLTYSLRKKAGEGRNNNTVPIR